MWWVRRRARWGIFREGGGWVGEVWMVGWNIMVGFWRRRWRLQGTLVADGELCTSAAVFFRPESPSGNASATKLFTPKRFLYLCESEM